jgi:hypothetical protein
VMLLCMLENDVSISEVLETVNPYLTNTQVGHRLGVLESFVF